MQLVLLSMASIITVPSLFPRDCESPCTICTGRSGRDTFGSLPVSIDCPDIAQPGRYDKLGVKPEFGDDGLVLSFSCNGASIRFALQLFPLTCFTNL
jgi:hypothetical protein